MADKIDIGVEFRSDMRQLLDDIKKLDTRVNSLKRSLKHSTKGTEEFTQAETKLEKQTARLESMQSRQIKMQEHYTKNTNKATRSLRRLQDGVRGVGGAFKKISGLISRFAFVTLFVGTAVKAIAGIGRVIGKAFNNAKEFATAMAEVNTILIKTDNESRQVADAIQEISKSVVQSPTDLAKGFYQVVSAGVTDTAEALEVLKVSAKAATAGITDTNTAVDAITTVINAFGKKSEDATAISDALFNTVKEGKLIFSDLANNIGKVAPFAAQSGIAFTEMLAALAALTKGGLNMELASTALKSAFVAILNPSKQAADLARKLGLEWNVAALKAKGLLGFLADVQKATKGNTEQITKLFGNARAMTAALALAGNQMSEFERINNSMARSAGATAAAVQEATDTLEGQADLLKSKIGPLINSIVQHIREGLKGQLEEINLLLSAIRLVNEQEAAIETRRRKQEIGEGRLFRPGEQESAEQKALLAEDSKEGRQARKDKAREDKTQKERERQARIEANTAKINEETAKLDRQRVILSSRGVIFTAQALTEFKENSEKLTQAVSGVIGGPGSSLLSTIVGPQIPNAMESVIAETEKINEAIRTREALVQELISGFDKRENDPKAIFGILSKFMSSIKAAELAISGEVSLTQAREQYKAWLKKGGDAQKKATKAALSLAKAQESLAQFVRNRGIIGPFGPISRGTPSITTNRGIPVGTAEQFTEALAKQELFNQRVADMAVSLDIGRTAAELFAEALANGTEGLKQFGPLLAGALKSTGAGFIGEAVSKETGKLRKSIAENLLGGLGETKANLLAGGLFLGAGALLGKLFQDDDKDKELKTLEKIARNTDRGNQLLAQLIGAPSDFIFPNIGALSYEGIGPATFSDIGRG